MKHHKEKFEFVERDTERVMQNALMTSAQGVSITISNTMGFVDGPHIVILPQKTLKRES